MGGCECCGAGGRHQQNGPCLHQLSDSDVVSRCTVPLLLLLYHRPQRVRKWKTAPLRSKGVYCTVARCLR
jgi:hypothetical protein